MPKNDVFGYFTLTELTGDPRVPELFNKILDARAIGSGFWLFYGGLTDLELALTVRDRVTGQTKTFTKPGGSFCGGADTATFKGN